MTMSTSLNLQRRISISLFLIGQLMASNDVTMKCMMKQDISMCSNPKLPPCQRNTVCQKQFNVSFISMEPYNAFLITSLVQSCCGRCTTISRVNTFEDITYVNPDSIASSHFVFPILGRQTATRLYGFYFIPLIDPPTHYYITARDDHVIYHLVITCLQLWPFLIITFVMVIIAGFFGWIMETWVNKDEFPREFLIGWFEGIWWSFVSMTTVGYGDKTPRSIPARLFSIPWILVGITTFCIITSILTNVVMKANSPPSPEMVGAKVAALRHRAHDVSLIAERGGILVEVQSYSDMHGILQMIQMLRSSDIDGFILDRYTYTIFSNHLSGLANNNSTMEVYYNYLTTKTIRTEKKYDGRNPSFGILVKNQEDYEFFSDFSNDNREIINTCTALMINQYSRSIKVKRFENLLFSQEYFWQSFSIVSVIVAAICLFGMVYEVYRRRCFGKEKPLIRDVSGVDQSNASTVVL